MLQSDKVRGDVRQRQLDYASKVSSLYMVIYSPKSFSYKSEKWTDNLWINPTNSRSKTSFICDALRIASRICTTRKIDLVTVEDPFSTGFIGFWLKKKYRIPLNVQTHVDFCDNQYWMKQRKMNRFFNNLGKFILKHADTIRVGTEVEKKKIAALGIPYEKINVIPVNSNLEKFQGINGGQIRNLYSGKGFDRIVLFSGRLVAQKDLPTLLKAFQIITSQRPSTLLLIVGKGPQETLLKRLMNDLQIAKNVVFAGSIDHNIMPEYLAACDIYSISSLFEGTCIAMVEAMAAGKPVVATRFAGAIDLIKDGENGFMVDQKDYRAIANKILYLLDNPEKAKVMGEQARETVTKVFANNQNIDRVIELWEKTARCKVGSLP